MMRLEHVLRGEREGCKLGEFRTVMTKKLKGTGRR